MNPQHTPGPWIQDIRNPEDIAGYVFDPSGEVICRVNLRTKISINNARLIAAAPELLEALTSVLLENEPQPNKPGYKAALAAIAKATGGAV